MDDDATSARASGAQAAASAAGRKPNTTMTSARSAPTTSVLFDHSNMTHSYHSLGDRQCRHGRTASGAAARWRPQAQLVIKARCWRPEGRPGQFGLHRSRRMALAVTSTVAPVSARMAGQRPVTPITVVTRKTAFKPRAMVMF